MFCLATDLMGDYCIKQ